MAGTGEVATSTKKDVRLGEGGIDERRDGPGRAYPTRAAHNGS
jgi:hypothetical protein